MSDSVSVSVRAPLIGASAFSVVLDALAGKQFEPVPVAAPPFVRLLDALHSPFPPSALDLAILVRHALRFQSLQPEASVPARAFVRSGEGWPTREHWELVNVAAEHASGGFWVAAQPWRPDWLSGVGEQGADAVAASGVWRRQLRTVPGDPFLSRFGRSSYQSAGQRAALRAALTMPPGATMLVCLPTGDGKSLLFQAIAEYGFGDGDGGVGVTLVITPTVALAMDHERAAVELGFPDWPRAYIGGSGHALSNQQLAARIVDGTQGLCFASPEAVCGPLRGALMQAARSGHLRALVLDEAHLVDTWGGNFRSEFQVLSGVRRDLLRANGDAIAFRTILLSATVTAEAEATLKTLFATDADGQPGRYGVSAAVRLRPEIEYWAAPLCWEDERRRRVFEAICNVPRPAIIYTTRVDDADRLYNLLCDNGFRRIARVSGTSGESERQSAVERWRSGSLDLVVGTSAFGLGIDNPNVRAVIHACIPETLDRFYQEVGRGGRDGRACLSLVIATERDRETAAGLNKRRLITTERGLQRWTSMFTHRDRIFHGGSTFTLRLDVAPGQDEHDIDMVSGQSTDWNVRTLTLMATSGLITLQGVGRPPATAPAKGEGGNVELYASTADEPIGVYQTIAINEPRHLVQDVWEQVVEPRRAMLAQASKSSLDQMLEYLRGHSCAASVLAPQYAWGTDTSDHGALQVGVAQACGGCAFCRANGTPPYAGVPAVTPYPWLAPPNACNVLDATNRLVVYYPAQLVASTSAWRRRFREALASLLQSRIHNVTCLPGSAVNLAEVQQALTHWPLFESDHPIFGHVPPGPALIIVPPGGRLTPQQLLPRQPGQGRVFLLPEGFEDPSRPGVPLSDGYNGRDFTWSDFLGELHL